MQKNHQYISQKIKKNCHNKILVVTTRSIQGQGCSFATKWKTTKKKGKNGENLIK